MKNSVVKFLLAASIALSLSSAATVAEAYHCRWVHSHYYHGRYVPSHRVCYGNHHHHGCAWRNGSRVCW